MKKRNLNKRGEIGPVILMAGLLFLILLIGFAIVVGGLTIDWVFDESVPILTDLGMVGDANVSAATSYALNPLNSFVQSFTWLAGVIYVLGLGACIGIAFAFRSNGTPWLAALWFGIMIILIIASIFMSNIYEDFYNDSGDVGDRMKEYGIMSYFILHSPFIMTVLGFIIGVVMFTGNPNEYA